MVLRPRLKWDEDSYSPRFDDDGAMCCFTTLWSVWHGQRYDSLVVSVSSLPLSAGNESDRPSAQSAKKSVAYDQRHGNKSPCCRISLRFFYGKPNCDPNLSVV